MMTLVTTKTLFPNLYFVENHSYMRLMKIHMGVGYSLLFPTKVRDHSVVPSSRRSNNLIGNIFMRKRGCKEDRA
jgi:hypothetical protein